MLPLARQSKADLPEDLLFADFLDSNRDAAKWSGLVRLGWAWIMLLIAVLPLISSFAFLSMAAHMDFPGHMPRSSLLVTTVAAGLFQGVFMSAGFVALGLHRRSLKGLFWRCVVFTFVVPLLLRTLLTIIVVGTIYLDFGGRYIAESMSDMNDADVYIIDRNATWFANSAMLFTVYCILRTRLRFFERGREAGLYVPIHRKVGSTLWQALDDIAQKCRKFHFPEIWYTAHINRATNESLPRVHVVSEDAARDDNILIVPRGFFKILQASPLVARAILSHELAHIYQGDAKNWSKIDLYVTALSRVAMLNAFVPLAGNVLSYSLSIGDKVTAGTFIANGPGKLLVLLPLVGCYFAITHARKKSEFLADSLSVCLVGPDATAAAIDRFSGDESPLHPSRRQRLANVEKLVQKYGIPSGETQARHSKLESEQ